MHLMQLSNPLYGVRVIADVLLLLQISLAKVKYLILDEADRMLDMGFLPDVMKLVNEMGMPPKHERQTLMFSATFPEEVQKLARDMLHDYIFLTVGRVGGANVDIEQRVLQVNQLNKRDQLVTILNEQGISCHSDLIEYFSN